MCRNVEWGKSILHVEVVSPCFLSLHSTPSFCIGLLEQDCQTQQVGLRLTFLAAISIRSAETATAVIMSAGMVPVGYTNGTSFKWNTPGQVIAAATVLPALGLIGVVLRFWSRLHRGTGFGLDDAFIIPALVCFSSAKQ